MSPTLRLLKLCAGWTVLAVFAVAWPVATAVWGWLGLAIAAMVLVDGAAIRLTRSLEIRRMLPGRFALGEKGEVLLTLVNHGRHPLAVEVFDGIPGGAAAPAMPWTGWVAPGRQVRVFHPVILSERGEKRFGPVHLQTRSRLGLWMRRSRHLAEEPVKVYPNYEPVVRFALLAMQHRENPLGIVRQPRTGASKDFRQLRDYRSGDPLAQIDWKATSRRQELISRDYQEQRNQSIIFMLDTGRRMRAMDGDLPQFDHILNAILLVSHLALRQGDQVAVKSFGGTDRWLPPMKGAHAMPVLLNHLYDYQTTSEPSDFAGAVERLLTLQKRRALVVVLTNLRGEDGKELVPALQVLRSRHLVLLASIRERAVEDCFTQPVDSFGGALKYLAAGRYWQERKEILAALSATGILTLDATAKNFAVALANRYHDIKSAGRI